MTAARGTLPVELGGAMPNCPAGHAPDLEVLHEPGAGAVAYQGVNIPSEGVTVSRCRGCQRIYPHCPACNVAMLPFMTTSNYMPLENQENPPTRPQTLQVRCPNCPNARTIPY